MATVAQIQAQLDSQGIGKKITIEKKFTVGTTDSWYVVANTVRQGKAGWVKSTNTDTAAQQATSITTGVNSL